MQRNAKLRPRKRSSTCADDWASSRPPTPYKAVVEQGAMRDPVTLFDQMHENGNWKTLCFRPHHLRRIGTTERNP